MSAGDVALVRRLAAANHLAVLATTRPDGAVHASLISAGVIDDPTTGRPAVGIVIAGAARKLAHLARSGRASVVFTSGFEWVAVEGPVTVIGPDDQPDKIAGLLRDVFTAAGGTHADWDEFDRVMAAERRVGVFVDAARITTN